ncbi:hypothetical protein CAHY103746_08970 [Campylobacter hyointestinalis subsp. hyointestinalis]
MVRKIGDLGTSCKPSSKQADANKYSVVVNGNKYNVEVSDGFDNFEIKSVTKVEASKSKAEIKTNDVKSSSDSSSTQNEIKATMPAGVFKILVKVGDTVGKGQTLIILEAMKMEIPIESPNAGVVSEILVSQGETVEDGQVLLKL